MATLKIRGIPPYDGDYDIPNSYTNGELHKIKQICGVAAGKLVEATQEGDVGVLVALTAVILERNGKQVNVQDLWDASGDNFDFSEEEAVEDADRPLASEAQSGTPGGPPNESDGESSPSEQPSHGGENGMDIGGNSQRTPLLIGDLGSVESAEFSQPTSPG